MNNFEYNLGFGLELFSFNHYVKRLFSILYQLII